MGKGFGHTAFAREDVADAKRGAPAVDLSGYAAARGLRYLGQSLLGAFRGVLPDWPEYTFNVMRGVLPGGRYGVLEHELQEIPLGGDGEISWPGRYWGTTGVYRREGGLRDFLTMGLLSKEVPNEPFARAAVFAPTTKVAVRVPETVVLPWLAAKRARYLPFVGHPDLDDQGAPDYRLVGEAVTDELRQQLFGGLAAQVLASLDHAYVELQLGYGALSLQRNGYAETEAELDALAEAACALAAAFVEAAQPYLSAPREAVPWFPKPPLGWGDAVERAAGERGMATEDPLAYHQAFPTNPAPGTAIGVLQGTIPGTDRAGRLAFHVQGSSTAGTCRGVAVWAAPAGAPAFEPGGTFVDDLDAYVEVVDGAAVLWNRARTTGGLGSVELAATAARAMATLDL